MTQDPRKLPVIDVVRGIAILYVMAGHSRTSLPIPSGEWAQANWSLFSQNAIYGVSIFFVISGFLITRLIDQGPGGLLSPDLKWFYARRAGRIVPLWTLVLVLGVLLAFGVDDPSRGYQYCVRQHNQVFDLPFWISYPTLCFNWFMIFRSRFSEFGLHWSVMWSLAVEEQFYLAYPWVLRQLKTIRRTVIFLCAVVLAGPVWRLVLYWTDPGDYFLSMFASFSGFDLIALGALLYIGLKHGQGYFPTGAWKNGFAILAGLTLVGAAHFGTSTELNLEDRVYGTTFMGLGTALCLWGILRFGIVGAGFFKPLTWPGRYSYGLYLFHATTLYLLQPHLQALPTWAAFLVYACVTTLLGAVSFRYFETPCNHGVRGWFGQK